MKLAAPRRIHRRRPLATAAALPWLALLLASCSTVKVKTRPELVTARAIESAEILKREPGPLIPEIRSFAEAGAERLSLGRRLERRGAVTDAAAGYLKTAADAHELLASGKAPADPAGREALLGIHNAALARFAELWSKDPRRLDPGPYHLESGGERFVIDMSPRSPVARDYFDRFVPAAAIQSEGIVSKTRQGIGAPLVGIREQRPERAEEMKFYPRRGLHMPLTLTMDSVTRPRAAGGETDVRFSLRNPLLEDSTRIGSLDLPLEADFSAPMSLLLKGRNEVTWGLGGFFDAQKRLEMSGIYLMEPYDPERIPVLLLHGLVSVPIIWRDIVPELASEPDISKRYQFMVFAYPSSFPIAESAKLLRDEIAALRAHYDPAGKHPLSRNLVVAGHSMGGVLSHSLVTEFGDRFWNQFSDEPFDSVPFEPELREHLRELVYFDPDPGVRRVVYFSAPHRGAHMAEMGLAGMISRVAKLPSRVVSTAQAALDPQVARSLNLKTPVNGHATSVQSLRPGSPMLAAMDESPYKKGVAYHSVIGDRGKGDTPNSSDGVVEYWSSRQDGAASELIVPTDHGSYKHPDAIAELKRILREHLRGR